MLMEVSATLVLAGLVLVLVLLFSWGRRRKDVNLLPGPRPLPLLGNLMQLDRNAPFMSNLKLSKSYGLMMTVYVGSQRCVVLVGYEALKEVLVDQAEDSLD